MKVFLLILALFLSTPASAAWTFPDKSDDVIADTEALQLRWNVVTAEANSLASVTVNGMGTLPDVTFSALGRSHKLNLSQFNAQLQVIGLVVFLLGVLLAIYIIFS